MCTFEDDRTVQVCDVAITAVRTALDKRFAGSVSYIHADGEPTRVVAGAEVSSSDFRSHAEAAIAAAQVGDL